MYWELKRRAPAGIPVYQQAPLQNDVWEALDGDKDDFLVYDRCGLLTFHIVLPFSFLHYPYVEAAIRATYQKNICNCSANSTLSSGKSGLAKNATAPSTDPTTTLPTIQPDTADPEEGRKARPVIHQHIHQHHLHHHHHHHHYHPASQRNQSRHQDTGRNETQNLHHHHNHHQPERHRHNR
ncbi:putative selenoprotein Pb-like [Scophthalmus maximus]|uniref:Putative selenoprotein Pb-like n=2 Tax=Scophthalmus maximus TaxID=52904 RepID=A0A2U9BMD2_SCOMX|nr:putative selenoprotein Pb-like [Scophthalmus maximus]